MRTASFLAVLFACLLGSGALRAGEIDCHLRLLDGSEVTGSVESLDRGGIRLAGEERTISFHELRGIRFQRDRATGPGAGSAGQDDPASSAFLLFASGEVLKGRVESSDGKVVRTTVRGKATPGHSAGEPIGEISLPLPAVRAFRLREPHRTDRIFEESLRGEPAKSDLIFVRRGDQLLKVEGVFRGLDEREVALEYAGKVERIRRSRVLGVILSPVAGVELESGDEGTLELAGGGRMPVILRGIASTTSEGGRGPALEVEIQGFPWKVDLRHVLEVSFASDRILFLSDLGASRVREVPFFNSRFPHRRDASVSGGALLLRGVRYRKGLGVHSRSVLEFELDDTYATFVSRVGIDDAVGARGSAAVRILGDGRQLWEGSVNGGEKPLDVLVSILGVRVLTLETDYGKDGLDLGDHVDWADARIVRPLKSGGGNTDRE